MDIKFVSFVLSIYISWYLNCKIIYVSCLKFSVLFQVKKNKKDPEKQQLMKQFIAWWIDKHYLSCPRDSMVVLFDMTDAGFANVVSILPHVT